MTLQHALFRFAGAVVVATPLGIAGVPSGLGIHVTFLSESVALAQSSSVVADETLAVEERSQLVPNQLIRGIPSDRIDGGALRGINLFHSFLEFNVAEGRGLYFSNPIGVENILTRVTGSSPSTLLGRLGVLGNANLFLLNPNGILFGANASLDITGSFLASTASAIPLGETGRFSATAPQTSTLLSVQPDTRFLTALARQGEISNAGTLNVGVGQRLMLVGGTVINRGTLSAPEGMVQVVGDRIWNAPTGVIRADGLETGNGGTVLLLSEEVARVDGSISVRGGSGGGNGGFVETSSRGALTIQMTPDIAAPNGQGGTWLIDPNNITIVPDGIGTTNVTSSNPFASTGDGATLEVGLIQTALRSGNVTIATTTAAPNTEPGTITLVTPLDYDGIGTDRTLTLDAHSSIFLVAPIQDSDPVTGDRLNLALNADIAGTGAGQVFSSNPISTQGGSIVARGSSIFFVRSVDSGGGAIDLTALNPTQGITLLDRLNAGSGNLTLTADNLFLVGSVEGSGDLLVQPLTPERDLQLGGATFSGEYLSTDALNTFQNGFRSITIGRADGRGTLSLGGTVFFRDPVTLRSPAGAIDTRPFDILGFDNAAITLLAAQNIQTSDIFNFYAGVGNPITLVSTRGSISTGSLIAGSQNGRAGNILLSAAGDITTGNLTAQGSSDSGTITLNSDRGSVTITGSVRSEMFSSGGSANGGTIRISAFGDITTTGNIFSFTSSNFGTGGDILLTSTAGNIRTSGGEVRSGNFGRRSGNIILTAFGNVTTGDISASSVALRNSESGNISITSTNGSIDTTAGAIETNSRGGNAGNIAFAAGGNIATGTLQSLGFSALDFGNGGNIELIADGSIVAGDLYTLSTLGRAGSVRLIAPGTIQLQSLFTSGQQSSGDVEIRSGQPFVLNNTLIFSDTFGAGDGGRIAITHILH
jgi:filamentous hemagglutinin family protein